MRRRTLVADKASPRSTTRVRARFRVCGRGCRRTVGRGAPGRGRPARRRVSPGRRGRMVVVTGWAGLVPSCSARAHSPSASPPLVWRPPPWPGGPASEASLPSRAWGPHAAPSSVSSSAGPAAPGSIRLVSATDSGPSPGAPYPGAGRPRRPVPETPAGPPRGGAAAGARTPPRPWTEAAAG